MGIVIGPHGGRSEARHSGVAVVHPGAQHARELVRALHAEGMLCRFVTSISLKTDGPSWLPGRIRAQLRARVTCGVPACKVSTIPQVEAIVSMLGPLLGTRLRQRLVYAGLVIFDKIAASKSVSGDPGVVVGFENSCRATFRKAKAAGALCVLDAASVHHSAQPAENGDMDAALRTRVNSGKDEEVGLADHVVVLSTYARDTYARAGVPMERISVIPPGIWLPTTSSSQTSQRGASGIHFVFVGNVKRAKGIDLLLAAFSRLSASGKRLSIVGSLQDASLLPRPLSPGVEFFGKLQRCALFDLYASADVLVLPSRADGFGFVVVEAMSSGLPVIVSSATGAKDLVEDGVSGWIFATGDETGLLSVMEKAAGSQVDLRAMGARAQESVAGLTWDAYGARTRALYCRLLRVEQAAPETKDRSPQSGAAHSA